MSKPRWHARPLVGLTVAALSTQVYQQLRDLDQALEGQVNITTLDSLTDVVITSGATGDTLYYDGTTWRNSAFLKNNLTSVTVGGLAGTEAFRVAGQTRQSGTSFVALGTITAPQHARDDSVTWNDAGSIFTGWRLQVTNTASNPTSSFLQLRSPSQVHVQVGTPFAANSPLVMIQNTLVTNQQMLQVSGALASTGSTTLMEVGSNSSGISDLHQAFRVFNDVGAVFSITVKRGITGLFGGGAIDSGVRIGGGNTSTFDAGQLTPKALTVGALFPATATTSHTLVRIEGQGATGTYTVTNVYAQHITTYLKAVNQTITTWYGLKIEPGPTAGTAWALYTDNDVRVGGNLVVTGTITGSLSVTLDSLTDVVITAAATGDYLRYDGANWVDSTIQVGDLPAHTHAETDITDGSLLARVAANESITGAWTFAPASTATAIAVTQAVGAKGIVASGGTQTTSQPVLDLAQTWNAGAVTFDAIVATVTDTASANASRLLDLLVGSTSRFRVSKLGVVTINANSTADALVVDQTGSGFLAAFNNTLVTINGFGTMSWQMGTLTTSRPAITVEQTWNASGVAFDAVRVSITNTASAAGARLLNLSVGGASKAAWDVNGKFYVQGTQVVETRKTGYTAMTGTADRGTAYATSTITLQQLAERVKALQDDHMTHGLIGA